MSWRRFSTLLNGLSYNSLFKHAIQRQEEVLEGEEAEKAVDKIW